MRSAICGLVVFSATALFVPCLCAQSPQLTVDAAASRHPINSWIYGINAWQGSGLQNMMRIPLIRWGGDDATSFNWQNSVKNNTGDNPWNYENYSVSPGFDALHEADLRAGTTTLGTVSLMDWTPSAAGPCSFSVAKYGAQQAVSPDNKDCGNGVLLSGAQVRNDPNDAYVPIAPAYSQQWVAHILSAYGPARSGGVRLWSLDNEPEWWDSVHYDIYKSPAGYDDMLARDLALASAVKQADPTALVTGPVPAGWGGMLFSKIDFVNGWAKSPYQLWDNPVDQNAHGGIPWIPWYLQQMAAAESKSGTRLLDVLDVHGYITPGALSATAGDAAMEQLRLTSTRAFWDSTYIVPGGQIWDATGAEVPPQLVPRLRAWVADSYPGTMTGISEYSWGALNSTTGALAQADLLGIFGREALDMATLWTTPAPSDPGAFAFRIFLNYDGDGSGFGDTSVSAVTTDPDSLSIFAAQRQDSALTILVLNKTPGDLSSSVAIANFALPAAAQAWRYSSANLGAIVPLADVAISSNSIGAVFPAYSMTLFVIPLAVQGATPAPVVNSVLSAASYDASGVAPGEVVVIFGNGLGPASVQTLAYDANGQVATALAGTQVLFQGVPAPIIYTSATQISVVVPYAVAQLAATSASIPVVVEFQGLPSAAFRVTLLSSHPAIFTNDSSGSGQGAILNVADLGQCGPTLSGCRNSSTNPAARGDYIAIYATGDGLTTPPGVDGRVTASVLDSPVLSCSVTIAGQSALVQYCGSAPSEPAGVLQVNALIPQTVTPGNALPVSITLGKSSSQPNVTMAVR